jgi:hypothetical protein
MRLILVLTIVCLASTANAQTITWDSVKPSVTDPNIPTDGYDLRHYMLRSSQDTMHSLVIFIPGTYRYAANYKFVMEKIALLGHHVLGISYKYDPPVNAICSTTNDVTCHYRARMETIDGTDRHPSISVNTANSILNRIKKAIQFMITLHPGQGWEQYMSGGQLQWNKIIIAGHSQGAALAGVMGHEFPAKRIVMFSVIDFLNSGAIPSWVDNTVNHENYYAFIHPKDELIAFYRAEIGWEKLGMTEYGAMANIDCNTSPFGNTHILYSNYEPATTLGDKHHNGTTLDIYLDGETAYKASLTEAIKYLFRK